MYIPDKVIVAKALTGLDQNRRDFAGHFADRISLLPPEALHDEKRIRSELIFELQSRFSPEEAARISYTSSDLLVTVALSIASERHQAARLARRLAVAWRIALGVFLAASLIIVLFYLSGSKEPSIEASPAAARK